MTSVARNINIIIKNCKKEFFVFILLSLPVYIIPTLLLFITENILDMVSRGITEQSRISFFVLGLILSYGFMKFMDGRSKEYMEFDLFNKVMLDLSQNLRSKMNKLPLSYYDDSKTYQMIEEAQQSIMFMVFSVSTFSFLCLNSLNLLILSIYMANINIFLIVFLSLLSFLSILENIHYSKFQTEVLKENSLNIKKTNHFANVFIQAETIKDIRINCGKNLFKKCLIDAVEDFYKVKKRHVSRYYKNSLIIGLMKFVVQSLSLIFILKLVYDHKITIAEFVVVLNSYVVFAFVVEEIFSHMGQVTQFGAMSDPYFNIMNVNEEDMMEKSENEVHENSEIKLESDILIEFRDVSFKYPHSDVYVLKKLNFSIKKGQNIAIVGENGIGKTTIIKLLLGLYKPTEGNVIVNKNFFYENEENSLKNSVSAVFQNFGKYKFTLRENIVISDLEKSFDDEKVKQSLRWSMFDENIELDEVLGKEFGGTELSGGQWQKIAFSRTHYRNRKIVIYDEPTSSIDPVAEVEIFRRILNIEDKESTILITHRLGSIRDVDRIIYLEEGKDVEIGTFNELVESGGNFIRLWEEQASWYV